ncbi:hypothetical protein DL769_005409 [Monosporascus sp. CRB-8-3]|nr:hypothetical protein DL769_005409 [Monosporascus sp. CRB-8-3]
MRHSVVLTSLLATAAGLASARPCAGQACRRCPCGQTLKSAGVEDRTSGAHPDCPSSCDDSGLHEHADPYPGRDADATDCQDRCCEALEQDPNCRPFCVCVCAGLRIRGPRSPGHHVGRGFDHRSTVSESATSMLFTTTVTASTTSVVGTTTTVAAFQLQLVQEPTLYIGQIASADANWATTDPAAALTCVISTGGRLTCGAFTAAQQPQDNAFRAR